MGERERLKEYRDKRAADRTPEPFGGGVTARRFVVQKHSARRLHYDLRLEWEGALLSWAVPKGPSPDPSDRRLAVKTEDHPLGYADFEGVIPQGNYGAGAMIVWDQGLWIPRVPPDEGLKEGKLVFELRGYKMRGGWELIRPQGRSTDPKEWLLFKKKDAWAGQAPQATWSEESVFSGLTVDELRDGHHRSRPIRQKLQEWGARRQSLQPGEVKLMLAEACDEPFSDPGWCFELKYDGYRVLAAKQDGGPLLRYRSGLEATRTFPAIARTLTSLPYDSLVMDGELVVLDEQARPCFQRLQKRGMLTRSTDIQRADVKLPAVLYLFDLLGFEDWDLRALTYLQRKELLRLIVPRAGPLRFADHVQERGTELFEQVRRRGLEGLMAKKCDAAYRSGRWRDWLKVRAEQRAEVIIVGFTDPKGRGRSGFGALELAVYDEGKLVYCGRVGTGFDQKLIDGLHSRLLQIVRFDPPCSGQLAAPKGVHWVEPELVCRVRFTDWTQAGNLRQPVFEQLLDEAEPRQCVRQYEHEPEPVQPQISQPGQVKIRRPAKVFWPGEGITKGDLADYYQAVSPWLLPFLKDRLLVLTRYPDGIEGKFFFQKDAPDYVPDWLRTERLWSENTQREVDYFVCDDLQSLLYLVNLGTIPLHIWSSRASTLGRPDWSIIDLDPKDAPFPDVVGLALAFRSLCLDLQLPCYCKTSGSSGLHVLIPLGRQCTYEQSRNLAELLARVVALEHPGTATLLRSIKKREGKVYLDTGQNSHGKLLIAPYSVRPLPAAPVSAPLHWDEVDELLEPRQFTLRNLPERLEEMKADPWQGLLGDRPDLHRVVERLEERICPGE